MKTTGGNPCNFQASVLIWRALGIALCFIAAGCTTLATSPSPAPVVSVTQRTSPLDYYEWAKTATESELEIELFGLQVTTLTSDPLITVVRTAIILSTSRVADNVTELKALDLVNDVTSLEAKDEIGKSYKTFAGVLQSLLQQREDLRKTKTSNQLALREIDSLKKRSRELQQQIEELTSIERQIIERERLNTLEP